MRKYPVRPAPLKKAVASLCNRWTQLQSALGGHGGRESASATAVSNAIQASIENLETRTMLSASWSTFTAAKPSGKAPQAVFKMLTSAEMVGTAVTVDGTGTNVGDGSPASSNYVWNFGDGNGAYNTLAGFNASHVYNNAGTYTISLTVTNDLGLSSVVSTTVKIAADTRRVLYVDSVSGSDNNSGSSPSSAYKTIYKADAVLGNNANTEILLKRGESFAMNGNSVSLAATNQLIGAYGTGANPILSFTGTADYQNVLTTSVNSLGVTFEDLSIVTVAGTNQPFGLEARGTDVAILNCTFNNVDYAVNANGVPTGLLVQNCSAPSKTGVYGYFVWGEGTDLSVIGNYAADSVNEHTLRATDYDGLLVAYNNFNNDDGKGCIEAHDGEYVWIAHNTVSGGDIRVGPLTIASDPAGSNTTYAVIDGNTFNNNSWMQVDPGSYHVSIRNNVINKNSSQAIYIAGADSSGRQDSDIQILNNTGVSNGQTGDFLEVGGVSEGIVLENNLVIAPELSPGAYGTAVVYVNQPNLDSFSKINGNVWQLPTSSYSYAAGGVMFIDPTSSSQTGYYTPAEWNALSLVGTDIFVATNNSLTATPDATIAGGAATLDLNVPIPSSTSVAAKADAPIGGVYTDFYGNTRSSSGTWSAGATQYGAPMATSPVGSLTTGSGSSSTSSGGNSSGGSSSGSTGGSTGGSTSSTGSVSGTVTDGGKGLAGVTVYLDANNNSAHDSGELSTTTDGSGNFSFTGVTPGAYVVRQILPIGIKQLTPTLDYGDHVSVSAGGSVTGQNFTDSGTTSSTGTSSGGTSAGSTGSVSGNVTDDGVGLAGVTVYLDANNNSALDPGELSITTDSSGNYSFTGVKVGAYVVRQILPSSIEQLIPTLNYGDHITIVPGDTVANFSDSISTFSTIASSSLPSGLISADVGSVGESGFASYSSSAKTFTVRGAGADIFNTADAFHYTYTSLNGNGTIVAEVSNLSDANAYAKAGVMIRNGMAANAAEVSMNLTPSKTAELDYRTSAGADTADHSITGVSSPEWVKLVRSGNLFSGYVSTDGKTWKLVSSATVSMASIVDIGLDVTSKNTDALETATFSNVAITA